MNSARRESLSLLYLFGGVIFILDQFTKLLAEAWLEPFGRTVVLVPWADLLRLRYVTNPGAAWGILPGYIWLFVLVALGVSLVCLWFMHRYPSSTASWPAVLLLAGGLGNMVDRLLRPTGVVDFIDMGLYDLRWPTFNLADVFLTIGIIWLGKLILFRQLPWDEAGRGAEGSNHLG